MGNAISYNSLDLQTTTYRTAKIEHTQGPNRRVETMLRARRDGSAFISGWYGERRIYVTGHIVAASAAALQSAVDALQAALNSDGANLDIGYGGGTRRYPSAVLESQRIPKEGYHHTFVPYELTFLVPGGVGQDTSQTNEGDTSVSSSPITEALTIGGSADALPVITVTFNSATAATILKIKNDDTGEEIIIGPSAASFTALDDIEVDCEAMTVKLNGSEHDFTGIFPTWPPGSANLRITVTATAFNIDWDFDYYPRYL